MSVWDTYVGTQVAGYANYPTPVSNKSFNKPNCTWYCWNRAAYQAGKQLSFNSSANAYQWLGAVDQSNCLVSYDTSTPVRNCIAVFSNSGNGHVVYVEQVLDGYVYFTEANFQSSMNGIYQKISVSDFTGGGNWRPNHTLEGYIKLLNY